MPAHVPLAAAGRGLTASAVDGDQSAWVRAMTAWHVAFWLLMALGLAREATAGDVAGARRGTAAAVIVAMCVSYAGLRPVPGELPRRNAVHLTVVATGMGVLCWADPALAMLLFIAYPQMWMFSAGIRSGLPATTLLTLSAGTGFVVRQGWGALSGIAPTMAVGLVASVLLGSWVNRIIDQSRERGDLIAELTATRSELAAAHHAQGVTAERERMAREIHDTLAQGYTSVIVLAQGAAVQAGSGPVTDKLALIETVARENLAEARSLVAEFSPAGLADGTTLTEALRRLVHRFGMETGLAAVLDEPPSLDRLTLDREVVLLRSVQEALTNVRRHARARSVVVRVTRTGDDASVAVVDDGVGFDPAVVTPGYGLPGMRDRVRAAGGSVSVVSGGTGTTVEVRVPAP